MMTTRIFKRKPPHDFNLCMLSVTSMYIAVLLQKVSGFNVLWHKYEGVSWTENLTLYLVLKIDSS